MIHGEQLHLGALGREYHLRYGYVKLCLTSLYTRAVHPRVKGLKFSLLQGGQKAEYVKHRAIACLDASTLLG